MKHLLHHLVSAQAQRRPEATALVLGPCRLRYGELEQQSDRLARALRAAGAVPGDRVCLLLPKSPWAVVAMLASLKAGCVYVPVDPEGPAQRAARILASCRPAACLAVPATATLLGDVLAALPEGPNVRVGWLDEAPPQDPRLRPAFSMADVLAQPDGPPGDGAGDPAGAAHILFTSGSTGVPKGVVITHANVIGFLDWALPHFALGPEDRCSGHSPLHFDLSTFDVYGTLAAGAQLHLVPPELNLMPNQLCDFIRGAELTQWFSVPSVLSYMARFGVVREGDFPALRRLLWCGEVFPTQALRHFMQRLPHVSFTNLYGPTEATIASSHYRVPACPEDDRAAVPIGTACAGEELLVLDDELREVPRGEAGHLCIAGIGLSPGYYGDPERTREAFLPDPRPGAGGGRIYRTGDLARVGEDGLVYFLGRADTQIKCRGYRIELGEVEAALGTLPGLAEGAVVAVEAGGFSGTLICCAYAPAPGSAVTRAALRQQLMRLLPPYMLPSRFLQMDRLPRNANGKIDRRALRARFEEQDAPAA